MANKNHQVFMTREQNDVLRDSYMTEYCIVTEGEELEPHVPTWASDWHINLSEVKAQYTVQMFVPMTLSFWNIMELYLLYGGGAQREIGRP